MYKHFFKRFLDFILSLIGLVINPLLVLLAVRGFAGFSADTPSMIEYAGIEMKEVSYGGYFRLLPYSKIKSIISSRDYNMTYFHLRDFEKEQSRQLTLRYFKNYYGINSAMDKFDNLISDFNFINIAQANDRIYWPTVPVIKL